MNATTAVQPNPMMKVLDHRDFRLLWIGQATSLLGDQFAMIALPWLVLQLTNDPLALGIVLALTGIARVICMLLGGAAADRISPRAIMLLTDLFRLVLWAGMAALVATGAVQLWMIYAFSLGSGIASGFFIPASNAILPRLISRTDLQAGNSIFQGTAQLAQSVGPALAGGLIAWFGHTVSGASAASLVGIAVAFAVDACTFVISVVTLWAMTPQPRVAQSEAAPESVTDAILDGIRYVWGDPFLRAIVIMIALVNFVFVGPLTVGVPVLANTRLLEGAAAYGIIMSAYALGNLGGILGAGALPALDGRRFHFLILGLFIGFGICLAAFGWVRSTGLVAGMLLFLGVGNGYLAVTLITLLQRRTPARLMGRMMSLVMVANMGLVPVSQALAGALSRWSLTGLFEIGGVLMVAMTIFTTFQKALKPQSLSETLACQPATD
ncbi:MAG TPA: MFS transporter [Anaerolineaceae bacterium]|jgi:MFS family permease